RWIDHLGDVLAFEQVQAEGLGGAFDPRRADLGHTVVVEDAGAPSHLDALARARYATARLAGDDDHADGRAREVNTLSRGYLGQVERVGRRAEDGSGSVIEHEAQASRAAHSTAGQAESALPRGRLEGGPKAEERAK